MFLARARAPVARTRSVLAAWRALPAQPHAVELAAPGASGGKRCSSTKIEYPPPAEGVAWHTFGFSQATKETKMVIATIKSGERWDICDVVPYGNLSLEPSATILNYGQGIFEGIKAYRTEQGRIVVFRPNKNGQRMADGARRMLMPPVSPQLFLEAVNIAVRENARWVPPVGQGALYLRPILFGSGADLGVKPSSEYTFCIYVTPVGQYFGPGTAGARMKFCTDHQRAAPLGIGHVKAAGNYAQCFRAQLEAKSDGFSDVIYLDVDGKHIDEAAASNFFCVDHQNVVHTPQVGTILPGVTRESVIQLLRGMRDQDIHLKVGRVSMNTVLGSREAFLTGTGAGIVPIEHISSEDESADFQIPGRVTSLVQKVLDDIRMERVKDVKRWLHDPFTSSRKIDSFLEPFS